MKIEFDGRVVTALFLGAIVGAVATVVVAAGPVGRIQRELDESRAKEERVGLQIGQAYRELQSVKEQCYSKPVAERFPQSQDAAVQVLNMVRPGLGTLAGAVAQGIKADQARRAAAPATAVQRPLVTTALSDACGPNGLLVMGECTTCNPGLHPGLFPDGSAGCIPAAEN